MGVQLSQVADNVPGLDAVVGPDVMITEIAHDSRDVRDGSLFVAIRGARHDGHDHIQAALDMGAVAVLVEQQQPQDISQIVVADSRKAMPWAAREVFGRPDEDIAVVGVTGTNGKTTVTHMLESVFRAADRSTGIIGTLGTRVDDTPIPTVRTTPEATDLQRILAVIRDSSVDVALMEVSSHAVELHRSDAIHFAVVGFTNLSQDHLDFHGSMDEYYEVKKQIFSPDIADGCVVNIGDPWGRRLADEAGPSTVTVSAVPHDAASIIAADIEMTPTGATFTVQGEGIDIGVSLPLVGEFNVANALVAIGMATKLGVDGRSIEKGLARLAPIPGRMEIVAHTGPFTVLVDYAHTPDAISAVLKSLRDLAEGRVIVVVGAGGDRDREKRPIMGAAAARLSDLTLVTTDNPRTEDPAKIAAEVARGALAQPNASVEVVIDRRSAIARAVSEASSGDIIVILGKGHEQGQDIGTEVLPFDDRHEAETALAVHGWEPTSGARGSV